jgi:hypothetical protein
VTPIEVVEYLNDPVQPHQNAQDTILGHARGHVQDNGSWTNKPPEGVSELSEPDDFPKSDEFQGRFKNSEKFSLIRP